MTTLYSVLNLARAGLSAQSAGVSVTSENISGANTPGYVRRNALLESFALTRGVAGGVNYVGTDRAFNRFAFERLVREQGHHGSASSRSSALTRAEGVLTPGLDSSISDRIGTLLSSFSDLALKADDPTARTQVVAAAQDVALSFNEAASGLTMMRSELLAEAQGVTRDINEKLAKIAELNLKIQRSQQPDGARAELMDQRDQLVREVGEEIGLSVVHDDSGSVTLLSSGSCLVDGGMAVQVAVSQDSGGNLAVEFLRSSGATDVTTGLKSGKLAGLVEARDVDLPQLLADLDQYAADFANAVNTVHAAGFGLDGVTGRPLFTAKGGGPLPAPPGTAYGLAVNPVVAADPSAVAAASNPGQLPGGNDVAVQLAQLATTTLPGGGTPAERFGALVGTLGAMLSGANSELAMRDSTVAHAESLRESEAGVSLDEEMVNLSRYQRAYEASMRVLQTADEMLSELMGRL